MTASSACSTMRTSLLAPLLLGYMINTSCVAWTVSSASNPKTSFSIGSTTMISDARPSSSLDDNELRILGVCGGIGSGKSHACRILVSVGDPCVAHLEADTIAHAVYDPKNSDSAVGDIVEEFGSSVLQENGEIDRKRLGEIVFSSPESMSKLEHIVWPHVKAEIQKQIEELRHVHKSGIIVLEAAVLLDAGWDDWLDAVWAVTASKPTRIQRLVDNRGVSEEEAMKRMEAQESRRGIGNLQQEVDRGVVTKVVQNEGSEQDLLDKLRSALQDPTAWKSKSSC